MTQAAGGSQAEVRRILVVTNMWPTDAAPMGGIFVQEQVSSLRKAGLAVDVLFVDGITGGYAAYLRGFGQVRRALRRHEYDLIHAHYVFSGIMALVGRLLAFGPFHGWRAPIVLTQHGIETQLGWTAPLCRWTSRHVEATIATSVRVRDALGAALRGREVAVIPCGVDTTLFRPSAWDAAREALGLALDDDYVLFAGMRRPEKRLDLIEAAVARLDRPGAPTHLLIADNAPHEQMPVYMNAANVLVLASEAEGSPMVVKEALACGLPVVSVDVGDVKELIGAISLCLVVERSTEALTEGIRKVLHWHGRVDCRVVERLALPAVAEQLMLFYQRVYERARAPFSSKLQTGSRKSAP